MTDLPHVTWLKAFEAAARHSSFSAAAAELNMTSAAVSQQIRLLEKHLGAQLFRRLPRGVALTDLGKAYAEPVRKSFDEMAQATDGLFGDKRKQVVRVRASISYAALVLAPRLAAFRATYPDVVIELTTAIWPDRFDDERHDLDIRHGLGDWQDGTVHHLGHEACVPVCHPSFAARFSGASGFRDMSRSYAVLITGSERDWSRLSQLHDPDLVAAADWLRVDSSLTALQAVLAGEGVALVLESFARQYLDAGLLVLAADLRLPKRRAHHLVIRDRADQREDVRQFADWLRSSWDAS